MPQGSARRQSRCSMRKFTNGSAISDYGLASGGRGTRDQAQRRRHRTDRPDLDGGIGRQILANFYFLLAAFFARFRISGLEQDRRNSVLSRRKQSTIPLVVAGEQACGRLG